METVLLGTKDIVKWMDLRVTPILYVLFDHCDIKI